MERSFDVLEKAAGNEGVGGGVVAMGTGLGAGIGMGGAISGMVNQTMNTGESQVPPPLPMSTTYFIYINGQQIGNQTVQNIAAFISQGVVRPDTLVWKNGLPSWVKAIDLPEIASLFNQQTPPPIPPQI